MKVRKRKTSQTPSLFKANFVRQVVQAEGPDMVVGAEDYPNIPTAPALFNATFVRQVV